MRKLINLILNLPWLNPLSWSIPSLYSFSWSICDAPRPASSPRSPTRSSTAVQQSSWWPDQNPSFDEWSFRCRHYDAPPVSLSPSSWLGGGCTPFLFPDNLSFRLSGEFERRGDRVVFTPFTTLLLLHGLCTPCRARCEKQKKSHVITLARIRQVLTPREVE